MKIHKKTKLGIKCNASRLGSKGFVTTNPKKVTCKKCLALIFGVHIGEMYQFKIPSIKLTDEAVEVI